MTETGSHAVRFSQGEGKNASRSDRAPEAERGFGLDTWTNHVVYNRGSVNVFLARLRYVSQYDKKKYHGITYFTSRKKTLIVCMSLLEKALVSINSPNSQKNKCRKMLPF